MRTDLKKLKFEVKQDQNELLGIDLKSVSLKRKINNDDVSTGVESKVSYESKVSPYTYKQIINDIFSLVNMVNCREQFRIKKNEKQSIRNQKMVKNSANRKRKSHTEQFIKMRLTVRDQISFKFTCSITLYEMALNETYNDEMGHLNMFLRTAII